MPVLDLARIPPTRAADTGADALGPFHWLALGDAGGLTQFGVSLQTLGPGGRTSDRHWHETEDEFVYVLEGVLTLVEDGGTIALCAGEAAAFPAGAPVGHTLENRSDAAARFLVTGTRAADDRVHYTTHDKIEIKENGVRRRIRRDGRPLP